MSNFFSGIRAFDGSQHRAWEELAYQVRDRTRAGIIDTRKTHAPDGGVEWYDIFTDGHLEGFQAKFYSDLASALGSMKQSAETVATNRPEMTRLTFILPFDFTDHATRRHTSDQDRWDSAVSGWQSTIPGADRLNFKVVRGGDILDRLTLAEHAGRRSFWFGEIELTPEWFRQRWDEASKIAGPRYTPTAHTPIQLEESVKAIARPEQYLEELKKTADVGITHLLSAAVEPENGLNEAINRVKHGFAELTKTMPSTDIASLRAPLSEIIGQLRDMIARAGYSRQTGIHSALNTFEMLDRSLKSRRNAAVESKVLGISGTAGQGKTHLVLQCAHDLLEDGTPAIVLMGQRFSDGPWWAGVCDQLGLAATDADTFFGALDALGEAHGKRMMILVDALNESKDPRSWRAEIPSLIQRVSTYRWVGLVVTWRSDYAELILGRLHLVEERHPGFAGVEGSALSNYCQLFQIPEPVVAVLDPAFTSPLFLRMYCEIRSRHPSANSYSWGRSHIFTEFAHLQTVKVLDHLRLSPASDAATHAIDALANALIDSGGRPVRRSDLEIAVDALLPQRDTWPDTLFGTMKSFGLFETSPSFDNESEVVGFSFQAFSEHLVVGQLLSRFNANLEQIDEFVARELDQRPEFWRAAAVLLPERYGAELMDLLPAHRNNWRLRKVSIDSFIDRDPSAFGSRAADLLDQALADEDLQVEARDAMFALAPRLGHPHNSLQLHHRLSQLTMADRDATWGILIYDALEESDRYRTILDWAVRGDARASDEQVLLVALPLVWVLTSPNRRLRDHTTKVLVALLRTRLLVMRELLLLCDEVDDPYLTERLLLIALGAVMRGGDLDLDSAKFLATDILDRFDREAIPVHVLARDAGRGIVRWAVDRGLLDVEAARTADPPYGSGLPHEPPTAEELTNNFGFVNSDLPDRRCSSILSSCLNSMGDFNKYVIGAHVRYFSQHPLNGPTPSTGRFADPLGEVNTDWAGRWVAWKAIDLGWTPERFARFEQDRDLIGGREAHKAERFGKKYQWLALHELLARLADNFHPSIQWGESTLPYQGPWVWFGRDLDPSLACSREVNGRLIPTVGIDESDRTWMPADPEMDAGGTAFQWATATSDFPATPMLTFYDDQNGGRWVALYRHSKWVRRLASSTRWGWDRQQWILQLSWLAKPGDGTPVFDHLSRSSLFNRWMPERDRPNRAYLGEASWSHVDAAEPEIWEKASDNTGPPDAPLVLPATEMYLWEGVTADCSLDESISFAVPTGLLMGRARWIGTDPEWSEQGEVVARVLRTTDGDMDHSVLLARETWLKSQLAKLDLELLVGILGERQALNDDGDMEARSWTEFTSVGLLVPGNPWRFQGTSMIIHSST